MHHLLRSVHQLGPTAFCRQNPRRTRLFRATTPPTPPTPGVCGGWGKWRPPRRRDDAARTTAKPVVQLEKLVLASETPPRARLLTAPPSPLERTEVDASTGA